MHSALRMGLFVLFLTTTLWGLTYEHRQNEKITILKFENETPLLATVLQPSTKSSKIFLKISGLQNILPGDFYKSWKVPERSSVAGFRIIPYNKNVLLIIDLIAGVDYQLISNEKQFEIHLKDAIFRDAVENDYLTGLYWQKLGDLDKALKHYRSVVKKRRSHPYAFFKAGQIRLKMRDYRKAEFNLKRALKNGCDSLGVYHSLAALYRIYGNSRLAKKYEETYRKWAAPPSQPTEIKEKNDYQNVDFVNSTPENKKISEKSYGKEVTTNDKKVPVLQLVSNNEWVFWIGGGLGIFLLFSILRMTWQYAKEKRFLRKSAPGAVIVQQNRNLIRPKKKPLLRVNGQEIQRENRKAVIAVQKQTPAKHSPRRAVQPHQTGAILEDPHHKDIDSFKYDLQTKNPQVEALIDNLLRKNTNDTRNTENNPDFSSLDDLFSEEYLISDESEKARQLAQKFNLGVGEIELALKLSTIQHKTKNTRDVRQQILNLKNQNLSTDEIARQAKLGKGEVELFLRFAETLNPPKKQ